MPIYEYDAIKHDGMRHRGEIEASSIDTVLEQLDRLGQVPVDIRPVGTGKHDAPEASKARVAIKPSRNQVTVFTRELAMMLPAGLTLDQALVIMSGTDSSSASAGMAAALRAEVADGSSFSEALASLPALFPPAYVNMIRVAEATGTIDEALTRIADDREREEKLRGKILSATLYPAFVIATAVIALVAMLLYVVPNFKTMLTTSQGNLPWSTATVIAASDWLIANAMLIPAVLAFVLASVLLLGRSAAVKATLAAVALRLPLIGHLLRLGLNIRFCRSVGALVGNGVELPLALTLTREVAGNTAAANAIDEANVALRQGQDFTEPLRASGLFFPVVINLLRVGTETGNLGQSANYLGRMFEEKLETALQRYFTILEPMIIVLVSLFVAGIMVSIIGAVISVNELAL